jgi:hypothetical protein
MAEGYGEQKQRMNRPVAMHQNEGTATQQRGRAAEGGNGQRERALGGGDAPDPGHRHSVRGDRITDAITTEYSR